MSVFIALDIGTTAVKGYAFNNEFEREAVFSREYVLETPAAHFVEMQPEAYQTAVSDCLHALLKKVSPDSISGIVFTTQGETLIPVDSEGNPLSKAVVWLDDRANTEACELLEEISIDNFYHTTGIPEINGALPLAKLMWFEKSAIADKVYKYLLLEDYLIMRMTGRFVTEQSLLSSTGYFDIINRVYWSEILKKANISLEKLPECVPAGTKVGEVSVKAAVMTGLLPGTPVISSAMDQICAAIGAGNVREGILTENTGTCLAVTATVEKPVFSVDRSVPVYAHFDSKFMLLAYNPTAAMTLKWFKDKFMTEFADELNPGTNIYEALTEEAARSKPRSGGVTMIPHLSGRLFPNLDSDMRGAFCGISLGTTREDIIRSILEGVSYMLRQCVQAVNELGAGVSEIRSVGGASVSPLWNKIKASVMNIPIKAMRESESTALGAAMLCALGTGDATSIEELEHYAVERQTYMPNAEWVEAYDKGYSRFEELNRRLSNLPVAME